MSDDRDRQRIEEADIIDNLPPGTRQLVYEYGWKTVKFALDLGYTEPSKTKRAVEIGRSGTDEQKLKLLLGTIEEE